MEITQMARVLRKYQQTIAHLTVDVPALLKQGKTREEVLAEIEKVRSRRRNVLHRLTGKDVAVIKAVDLELARHLEVEMKAQPEFPYLPKAFVDTEPYEPIFNEYTYRLTDPEFQWAEVDVDE